MPGNRRPRVGEVFSDVPFVPSDVTQAPPAKSTSRGTIDRSVHRDALSAATFYFEAAPPSRQVFVDPAELPLCAALMVGGSISRLPTTDWILWSGNKPTAVFSRSVGSNHDVAFTTSIEEVSAIFATDRFQKLHTVCSRATSVPLQDIHGPASASAGIRAWLSAVPIKSY